MKCQFYLLLFLVTFNCEKEKVEIKKSKIEVNEKYIKYSSDKLYKQYLIESENDSERYDLKRLIDSSYRLPYGKYKLVYSSFYRMHNEIKFTVNSEKTVVEYYPDSLNYSQIKDTKCCLLIDRLKSKEILNLYVNESGCFSGYDIKLEITKRGSDYYIETNYYKNKKLNSEQLRLLREFEFEVYNLDLSDFYCTNTEKYLFLNSSTNEFVSKENSSCWYYGFGYFMQSLKE